MKNQSQIISSNLLWFEATVLKGKDAGPPCPRKFDRYSVNVQLIYIVFWVLVSHTELEAVYSRNFSL